MKLLPILAVAARESSKEPDPRSESYPRDLAQFRQEEKRSQFRALISGDLQCIPEVRFKSFSSQTDILVLIYLKLKFRNPYCIMKNLK